MENGATDEIDIFWILLRTFLFQKKVESPFAQFAVSSPRMKLVDEIILVPVSSPSYTGPLFSHLVSLEPIIELYSS